MLLNPGRGPRSKAESQQANPPHPRGIHHGKDAERRPQTDPERGKKGGSGSGFDIDEPTDEQDGYLVAYDLELDRFVLIPERWVDVAGDTMTGPLVIRYGDAAAILTIVSPDGDNDAGYVAYAYGAANSPRFAGSCADGTEGSPTNTKSGQYLAEFIGGGYTGSAYVRNATLRFVALENWATGARGSALIVFVTPIGSAVEAEMLRVASAGVGVGVGGANDAAAKLQIDSTTQGLLPPRMTTAQKNAISSPPDGLEVYDTDLDAKCIRANGAWTALVPATALGRSGTDTPAQITSNQNDYAIGSARYQCLSTDATRTITGIVATFDGDEIVIVNVGANDLTLVRESAASSAANRIITNLVGNVTLNPDESATLVYYAADSRWRIISTTGG